MLCGVEDKGDLLVYTDASISGRGGVLKQFRPDENREVPTFFVSKKFSSAAMKFNDLARMFWNIL